MRRIAMDRSVAIRRIRVFRLRHAMKLRQAIKCQGRIGELLEVPLSPECNCMNLRTFVLAGVVLLTALARLLPHPPNFTPIGALALFGAAHFQSRWAAFLVPLVAMFISDVGLQVATSFGLVGGWLAVG